jgi:signal transduction histidine kinase
MSAAASRRISAVLAAEVTEPPAPRSGRLRRGRFDLVVLADLLIAVLCFATTNSWLATQNGRHGSPHSTELLLLVALVTCVPLLLRNRFPLGAWSASVFAIAWGSSVIPPRSLSPAAYLPAALVVYGLCLYAVAARCKTWIAAGVAVATVAGAAFIDPRTSVAALLAAIPLLGGAIVRSRRTSQRLLAAQQHRHEGERALLEERQRIARELHDVVAHHMSVIAIQAEAAPYKTPDPPRELVESLTDIRASALAGLDELRRLLGVLRSDGPDIAPQPGLDDLPGLLESARNGGITVTAELSGQPRAMPQGVDLSAYRIVQEALSNALRHAPGSTVRVGLAYRARELEIRVRDDAQGAGTRAAWDRGPGAARSHRGGHGIIGMRERAAMLGGQLDAGPAEDGGFLFTAVLPLDRDRARSTR